MIASLGLLISAKRVQPGFMGPSTQCLTLHDREESSSAQCYAACLCGRTPCVGRGISFFSQESCDLVKRTAVVRGCC